MSNLENLLKANGKPFYTGNSISLEDSQSNKLPPYLPSPKLVDAVNLSIFLENRPLLLKGEPGCGKTRLAEAVAEELKLPYKPWYIKSTTKAKDGLYTYDAVRRLYDAQLPDRESQSQVKNLNHYITKGPLGSAFENKERTVVLIDEIDKADIDFPNDLLRELDEQKFKIEETGDEVEAKYPPIVFITSNDEKDLPDAFLRRCLFYYIEFPSNEELKSIVNIHFPESSPDLVEVAVNRFTELRHKMQGKHDKKVSTSELLDWFAVLREFPEDDVLKKLQGEIPFPEILLKKWEDHQRYLAE